MYKQIASARCFDFTHVEAIKRLIISFNFFINCLPEASLSRDQRVAAFAKYLSDAYPQGAVTIKKNRAVIISADKSMLKLYFPNRSFYKERSAKVSIKHRFLSKITHYPMPSSTSPLTLKEQSDILLALLGPTSDSDSQIKLAEYLEESDFLHMTSYSKNELGAVLRQLSGHLDLVDFLKILTESELSSSKANFFTLIYAITDILLIDKKLGDHLKKLSYFERQLIGKSAPALIPHLAIYPQETFSTGEVTTHLLTHLHTLQLSLPDENRYAAFLTRKGFLSAVESLDILFSTLLGNQLEGYRDIPTSGYKMPVYYDASNRYPHQYSPDEPRYRYCDLFFYIPEARNDKDTATVYDQIFVTVTSHLEATYGLGVVGFQGYITPDIANATISEGNVPIELTPSNGLVTHGMWTHLFGVLMILISNKATKANAVDILKGLIQPIPNSTSNSPYGLIWNIVMDTGFGSQSHVQRSPFFLNSFLLFRNSAAGQLARFVWEVSTTQCQRLYSRPASLEEVVKNQVAAMSTVNEFDLARSNPMFSNQVFKIGVDGYCYPLDITLEC
jgi:hypothetical protein